jgi:hypothetical protein
MQEVVLNSNACSKFVVLLSIKFINFESLVYIVDIFSLNIFYLRIFQLYLFVYMIDLSDLTSLFMSSILFVISNF